MNPPPQAQDLVHDVSALMTSTLTAYLTPNTHLSTPRLRYCIPRVNNASAEQLCRAMLLLHCPIKSFAATGLPE